MKLSSGPTSVLRGVALTVAMRWADRLIGIASTVILARILVPADFGIIAMSSLVINLVDVLFELGVHIALIQNRNATREHYHTAWTLRVMQGAVSMVLIIIAAPYAADYFNDQRLTPVLQVAAIGVLLLALENIGIIDFQKDMRFGLDFKFAFSKRIAGFIATVVAALVLRNYWALVIGSLVGRLLGVLLSYYLHPLRPRFTLSRFKEIFAVSQWMLLRSIIGFASGNAHKFIVGGRSDAATMGGYSLALQISSMPTSELLTPLNRVLFPVFVKVKHDPVELKRVFLLAQGVQTLVAMPMSVGLVMLAHEAVSILLGAKWMFVVPFVQLMALAGIAVAITTSGSYLLMTRGEWGKQTVLAGINLLVFLFCALVLRPDADALGIAQLRLALVLLALSLSVWLLLNRFVELKLVDVVLTIARPLLGVAIMAAALYAVDPYVHLPAILSLLVKAAFGASVYLASIAGLWWLSGRPVGGETYIFDKLRRRRPT